MRQAPQRIGLLVGALMMVAAARAGADGKPLHLALSMADPDRQGAVHEAVMVALTKAGFDATDEDAVEPDITDEDVHRLSAKHHGEAVLLLKVEGDASGYHVTALAVTGKTSHTEEADAKGQGLARSAALTARLAAVAVSPNLEPAVRRSSSAPSKALADESSSELLGGPIGRYGLEIGLSGLGVLLVAYIPCPILAGSYSKTVPNATRAGVVPIAGPFQARTQLSDELLNDGASAGLITDGILQLLGTAGFVTGAGMITYAKIQQAREAPDAPAEAAPAAPASGSPTAPAPSKASPAPSESGEPQSVLPSWGQRWAIAPVFSPTYTGMEVAFAW